MKDKIKEILDFLKNKDYYIEEYDYKYKRISLEDAKILSDYITNLQEENERLKETIENLTTMTVCGDKKQIKNTAQYKLDIYKSRNEKAIEYVKENQYIKIHEEGFTHEGEEYYILPNSDIVLDILQGEDNE